MSDSKLTPELVRKYYETRLKGQRLGGRAQIYAKCPLHEDKSASLSINMEKGVWKCHAGCGDGDLVSFEMKFTKTDRDSAKALVAELLGEKQMFAYQQQPEKIYQYTDARGKVLFEKLRYPGKRFVQRRPNGKGGYEYKSVDGTKPLYRLHQVITATDVIVCEGEKDADNVAALELSMPEKSVRVAATCNFDGAGPGKWHDDYAVFFAGKHVVVFPDNDDIGRRHADHVAKSVSRYAAGVKLVNLPGLEDHGDVSDYLAGHSKAELLEHIRNTKSWRPSEDENQVLVTAQVAIANVQMEIDWLIEGVIERGANGFISAAPKVGKSWVAIDMALALAAGRPWLEFNVPAPVRVALISREDTPGLTGWRIKALSQPHRDLDGDAVLYVNTRAQTPDFKLDVPELLAQMIEVLTLRKIEFALFDVFNRLHTADENDNSEMTAVLAHLTEIQKQAGCCIGVVHHYSKADTGSLTQRLRGASAIAGWAEWLIGVKVADEETRVRRMEFELKAASPPDAIYFTISSDEDGALLERTLAPEPEINHHNRKAKVQ